MNDAKKILFKKRRILGNQKYDIELSITGNNMSICASSLMLSEDIIIDVPKDKSNFKYNGSKENYGSI